MIFVKPFVVFPICSLLFIIILAIVYFVKPRIKSIDNLIYRNIIITTIIGLVLEILCYLAVDIVDRFYYLAMIILKGYVLYIILWPILFNIYVCMVTKKNNKDINDYYFLLNKVSLIIYLVFSVLVIMLPLYIYNNGVFAYTYGPSVNIFIFFSGVAILSWMFKCFKNIKQLKAKKYIPIIICIILLLLSFIIMNYHREAMLITTCHSIVVFLMFFTIENPDVKMINALELAKDQAEKANRAKTDFLSSMSHEIRTPLNAVVGFSDCIKDAKTLEEAKEDANDIIEASQNLLEIVNGILDISKIEANKMEIVCVNYEPRKVFDELLKLISTRIGEKDIKLERSYAIDLPETLYGDKSKVKQIITNLLTNAVKYTDKGKVEFKVDCVNTGDESRLMISVSDTGRGIKAKNIDKLFTKFNRLEEDRNTTIEGTGLGLAITKRLVEMMNGKIVVQSTYGVGSVFTVYLPQKIVDTPKDEMETKEISAIENMEFPNKKVLVVDDNLLNIKVANKILGEFKLKISSCENGFDCIDKIKNKEKYDLILMDIMMPKMNGVETLKKLKEIEGFNTPVIALTADAMEGVANKYIDEGFDDYLAKPINRETLKKALNKFLN